MFMKGDMDRDGKLNMAEVDMTIQMLAKLSGPGGPGGMPGGAPDMSMIIAMIDKDGDGCIKFDEFWDTVSKFAPGQSRDMMQMGFGMLDQNGDGCLRD